MIHDTIMVRINITSLRELLSKRDEIAEKERDQVLGRILSSFQAKIEEEAAEFEQGNGHFEACFFDAL